MQTQTQQAKPLAIVQQQGAAPAKRENFIMALAGQYGMTAQQYWDTIKNTMFKEATDAECNALLMVAHEYSLNPLRKEIYAFRGQSGGIVPMVPIDGWITMVNRHPLYAGHETVYPPEDQWTNWAGKKCPPWVEVIFYRVGSDRAYPHREYMDECFKEGSGPWKSHPKRMLKHKAFIQAARYALGYSGVYDEDEARNIIDVTPSGYDVLPQGAPLDTAAFDAHFADILDDPQFKEFVTKAAQANSTTVEHMKAEAASDLDGFEKAFKGWALQGNGQAPQEEKRQRNYPSKDEMTLKRENTKADLEELGVFDETAKAMGDKGQGRWDKWNSAQCELAKRIGKEIKDKKDHAQTEDMPPPEVATVTCPVAGVVVARDECPGCSEFSTCKAVNG